ncbi:MAG: type IV pilin N-terminal domain-containing protein [Candidatus Methanoperedens sp.]|nr:type IV pilin N-terminal domain-containing protein [Candidatus Methanoperedens sp.]CAG0986246.1 hypothetical protein METP1_02045 [Methanosarcinales archaeon]
MRSKNNEEAVSPVIGVILMVAITVILAAVIAAFVFGMSPPPKAPTVQLRISAINSTDAGNGTLKLTHNGGDALILANEKITVTDAVDDSPIGTITGLTLIEFQVPVTTIDTLGAGASITYTWDATDKAPAKGTILKVMLQDVPSGQVITQMQVTVT